MKVIEAVHFFADFYKDFDMERACTLLAELQIDLNSRMKHLSKGNKEKFN